MRLVPVDESTRYVMSPQRAMKYIDENTIGVMVILGSTYTGAFENVQEMSDLRAYHLLASPCTSNACIGHPCSRRI